eukprot:SAG31_NODE_337_length_17493_cov_5.855755_9_plen_117_part_00
MDRKHRKARLQKALLLFARAVAEVGAGTDSADVHEVCQDSSVRTQLTQSTEQQRKAIKASIPSADVVRAAEAQVAEAHKKIAMLVFVRCTILSSLYIAKRGVPRMTPHVGTPLGCQ